MSIMDWLFRGTREARQQLDSSVRDRPAVAQLGADLRRIERENHISSRIHSAARGEDDNTRHHR